MVIEGWHMLKDPPRGLMRPIGIHARGEAKRGGKFFPPSPLGAKSQNKLTRFKIWHCSRSGGEKPLCRLGGKHGS